MFARGSCRREKLEALIQANFLRLVGNDPRLEAGVRKLLEREAGTG